MDDVRCNKCNLEMEGFGNPDEQVRLKFCVCMNPSCYSLGLLQVPKGLVKEYQLEVNKEKKSNDP